MKQIVKCKCMPKGWSRYANIGDKCPDCKEGVFKLHEIINV